MWTLDAEMIRIDFQAKMRLRRKTNEKMNQKQILEGVLLKLENLKKN